MANNQDARPFVDLKKDAVEFLAKFNEDIAECAQFLDVQITALICDPDSVRRSTSAKDGKQNAQNALVDFSKAKYDIFVGVKSLINRKEQEWQEYISEMKKLFVENVEIFLAGTKLEVNVKLPSEKEQSGPRKSPGVRRSTSAASSGIPIFSSIARNMPALSSPFRSPDVSKAATNVGGNKVQINRGIRSSALSTPRPSNLGANVYENDSSDSSEDSPVEFQPTKKSSESATPIKLTKFPTALHNFMTGRLLEQSRVEPEDAEDNEMDTEESGFVPSPKKDKSAIPATRKTRMSTRNVSVSLNQNGTISKPARGRRGKADKPELKNIPSEGDWESSGTEQITIQESKNHIEEAEEVVPSVQARGRRGRSSAKSKANDSKAAEIMSAKTRRGRSEPPKNTENSDRDKSVSVVKTPGRSRRGFKTVSEANETEFETPQANKKVTFTAEVDVDDNLDVFSLATRPIATKSTDRHKSWKEALEDMSGNDVVPGTSTPGRKASKRKTISFAAELHPVTPSKRLKAGSRKSVSSIEVEDVATAATNNLSESDDCYSDWMPLKNVDGKIPTRPAIYEIKVWRAKKTAYIGYCESLRQKLTLYMLRQNSGHKHLDKFVERNFDDIQIRFEVVPSFSDCKTEVKNRIDSFKAQYKTLPAYN